MSEAVKYRDLYGSDDLDSIFIFLMKTYLRNKEHGRSKILFDIELKSENCTLIIDMLRKAVELTENAQPPEIQEIIMAVEYQCALHNKGLSKKEITALVIIRDIAPKIMLQDDVSALLKTGNLWGCNANDYAIKTFYPNLPHSVLSAEGLDHVVNDLPENVKEPDNY